MTSIPGSHRIRATLDSDPLTGKARWAPVKSLWIGSMTIAAILLCPLFFSWEAVLLFMGTSAVTLCFGHSVGMHRRLIHESFQCPLWLERTCVYLGVLVGMAGPFGMIRLHDMRDWAQRQPACHDFFAHRAGFWRDGWEQLHCTLVLDRPPEFELEPRVAQDRFYQVLERTWMWQQLPWAALFFLVGGLDWLVWGICARVAVCVTGHWLVGHFAHREGDQSFVVEGAAVQGYNVTLAGLISMGESWHNNHHAYPGSARLGLYDAEVDLGWTVIQGFARLGLAWDIVTPDRLPARAALKHLPRSKPPGCPALRRGLNALAAARRAFDVGSASERNGPTHPRRHFWNDGRLVKRGSALPAPAGVWIGSGTPQGAARLSAPSSINQFGAFSWHWPWPRLAQPSSRHRRCSPASSLRPRSPESWLNQPFL